MIQITRITTRLSLLFALLCFTGAAYTVFAQEETAATINGQVTDSTGAVITNATVVVTNTETNAERQVQTNDNGLFIVTPLSPGTYIVTIEQANFKRYEQTNLVLNARDRRIINIALEAGNVSEVVTVTAEENVIQDSSTTQSLISGTQVIELPLVNRDFTKLTELVPGVSSDLDEESGFGLLNRVSISIAGNRRNSVNFLIDGVSNTDVGSNITLLSIPTVDSIREFKVLTSNYTAEVGRSGGGTVTVVTRGGGNEFHGSLYEFIRNDYFNANSFPRNRVGISTPPPLRYNNFGGTLSGPVPYPDFTADATQPFRLAKDKTFFFFSQEYRRQTRGTASIGAIVPRTAQRTGDFSFNLGLPLYRQANGTSGTTVTATPLNVFDTQGNQIQARAGQIFRPSDGRAYSGNIIPTSDINPLALPLLAGYPLPDSTLTNLVTTTAINRNDTQQSTVRIDHNFNSNNRLFGRYTHDVSSSTEAGGLFNGIAIPGISTTNTDTPGQTFVASYTSVLTPTIVNEATYNFSGNHIQSALVGRGRRSDYSGSERIPEAFAENNQNVIPSLTIAGLSTLGAQQGFDIIYKNHVIRDNVIITRGNHLVKFGGEVSFESKDENAGNNSQGAFNFNGAQSRGRSTTGVTLTQTGIGFADYLLGRAATYSESEFDVTVNLKFGRREFFAQDTWKVRPNLTLDYGVRYQYFVPVVDKNNVLATFNPNLYSSSQVPTFISDTALQRGTGSETNGIGIAGQNSPFGRQIYPSDKNNFSPRVGFAYDPFSKGQTVIRAGYGFFYDQPLVGIFEVAAFTTPPFNNNAVYSTGSAGVVTLDNPTAGAIGALSVRSVTAIAPDFETPTIQHYSLGIQHQPFRNAVIDVGYVGTKGDNLIRRRNINFVGPAETLAVNPTGANAAAVNRIRPYLGYGVITNYETSAKSRYNGLLSSFNYRFGNGFSFTTSYTFSKTLTDSSNDRDLIDEPQNPFNLQAEYAEARTSRPHVFNASYVYEFPFFNRSSSKLKRLLLGGYQISGLTFIESGPPITRVIALSTNGGTVGQYANLVGDPRGGVTGTIDPLTGLPFYFDPSAFETAAPGTYGNSPRSFARGPGRNSTNLSLTKNLNFNRDGTSRLQLRAEAFNVFNHTQFLISTGASQVLGTTTIGRPQATRLPREFQFGARLSF